MGKGNFGKLERTFDRHAGSIDRAIAREKKLKAEGRWKEPKKEVVKRPEDMTFKDKWPVFSRWEMAVEEYVTIGNVLSELRDYHAMKGPQEAYNWIKAIYEDKVEPKAAAAKIKDKLMW